METHPRPRVSLKVAYFLTDCTETNRGNFHAVPGSHLRNKLEMPEDEDLDPAGAGADPSGGGRRSIFRPADLACGRPQTFRPMRAGRCFTAIATAGCGRAMT